MILHSLFWGTQPSPNFAHVQITSQDEVEDGCEGVAAALLEVTGAEAAGEEEVLAQVLHEELRDEAQQSRDGTRCRVDGEGDVLERSAELVLVSCEGSLEICVEGHMLTSNLVNSSTWLRACHLLFCSVQTTEQPITWTEKTGMELYRKCCPSN